MEDLKKWCVSLLIGAWATFKQEYAMIMLLIGIAIIIDFGTGMIKAYVTGVGIQSQKGYKGFLKKISLLLAFGFGIFLDVFVPYCLEIVSIELPFNSPFALVIGCYIIINESISVCENLYEINSHILPSWIVKLLKGASEKINNDNQK